MGLEVATLSLEFSNSGLTGLRVYLFCILRSGRALRGAGSSHVVVGFVEFWSDQSPCPSLVYTAKSEACVCWSFSWPAEGCDIRSWGFSFYPSVRISFSYPTSRQVLVIEMPTIPIEASPTGLNAAAWACHRNAQDIDRSIADVSQCRRLGLLLECPRYRSEYPRRCSALLAARIKLTSSQSHVWEGSQREEVTYKMLRRSLIHEVVLPLASKLLSLSFREHNAQCVWPAEKWCARSRIRVSQWRN